MNHFARLELKVEYDIDIDALTRNFLIAQSIYHPDRHKNMEPDFQEEMAKRLARITQAFNVLRSDVDRAEYILQLHGVHVEAMQVDIEFAEQEFARGEMVNTALQCEDTARKAAIEMCNELSEAVVRFNQYFEDGDFQNAALVLLTMKSLSRAVSVLK